MRALLPSHLVLALAVLALLHCTPGFDPPSKVNTVRILAVTVDKPYALPGDDITVRMTVDDALANDGSARPLQVVWVAGCVDPEGDQFFLCFEQLAEAFAPLAQGGLPPADLFKIEELPPELSGVPDALEFTFSLPDDIVSRRPAPPGSPHYGIAYVFFAACAGTIQPTDLESLGGEVPEFPLNCVDDAGTKLGPESFVIGYTQVYAFADGRLNANPPMAGITIDEAAMPLGEEDAAVAEACPVSEQERRETGCAAENRADDCKKYTFQAIIGNVAEVDADNVDLDGNPLREVLWVSYFADGGDLDPALSLVSDATKGYQESFDTEWTPPEQPGLYSIWAVARDQRGGSTVLRRFVRVE